MKIIFIHISIVLCRILESFVSEYYPKLGDQANLVSHNKIQSVLRKSIHIAFLFRLDLGVKMFGMVEPMLSSP